MLETASAKAQPPPVRGRRVPALTFCLLPLVLFAGGCGDDTPGADHVGDMSDRSYFGARGKARVAANGDSVRFEQFEGRFVWATYSASWCGYCDKQAPVLDKVERSADDDVVFLTVMTSDQGGYGDPATRSTAKQWARRHGLDPARVVAADLSATTIPRHIFYSPEGQMLFLHSGFLSAERIREALREQTADWNARFGASRAGMD